MVANLLKDNRQYFYATNLAFLSLFNSDSHYKPMTGATPTVRKRWWINIIKSNEHKLCASISLDIETTMSIVFYSLWPRHVGSIPFSGDIVT